MQSQPPDETEQAIYTTTDVVTTFAWTAKDLGTFTLWTTVSRSTTLNTITETATDCFISVSSPIYSTVYIVCATGASKKRALDLSPSRDSSCAVTSYFTTTYGHTQTLVAAPGETSTFTQYPIFTQANQTSTATGVKAYAIATASAATTVDCNRAQTVTQDAKCAPIALTSAYKGYRLEYASDVPGSGAVYSTNTTDASQCCQLCAEAWNDGCAASLWDSRTGACKLEFPVAYDSGDVNCGEGALVYYDLGRDRPMEPGSGLWVANLCGSVEFGSAKPDEGR